MHHRQMVKAVIFDVDSTLVDSVAQHARAWQETFKQFGKEVGYEDVRNQIGKGGENLVPVFLPREQIEHEGKTIENHRKQIFDKRYKDSVRPFPRVRELFQRLQADGVKIALASSAKSDELQFYKRLAHIEDLLDTETSSDDVRRSKPEPDIFVAALDRLGGVNNEEVVVVGDSPYDAEAAKKTNLRAIGLLSGGFSTEQLRGAGCAEIYRDPAHLLDDYEHWVQGNA